VVGAAPPPDDPSIHVWLVNRGLAVCYLARRKKGMKQYEIWREYPLQFFSS
jgi:hypothetical protein